MGKRHEAIGIKQAIRFEWMQKAANLLLAGLDAKTIRQELHEFLSNRKAINKEALRGQTSRTQVVNMLMKIWISPDTELAPFRNSALELLHKNPSMALPLHWGMISADYPFWLNAARQTGRLLALQDQVTQKQIIARLKEKYGDRQTVSRCGRHAIRSFILWGILRDSNTSGNYTHSKPYIINNPAIIALLVEAVLHSEKEPRFSVHQFLTHPAIFPFQISNISAATISDNNTRIKIIYQGLNDELLTLR